ncbi:hypothetical protein NSPZN2_110066 [Nitrospira defluvii]|uniref:Uncharacterized protein n=1 Tax=Nitrospira defluvii TaxID=330214 RepID=A0ABM8R7I5_9BACT|nr:hypothetical protein NSPZN2_110066 [Nitrospira defluvii]
MASEPSSQSIVHVRVSQVGGLAIAGRANGVQTALVLTQWCRCRKEFVLIRRDERCKCAMGGETRGFTGSPRRR